MSSPDPEMIDRADLMSDLDFYWKIKDSTAEDNKDAFVESIESKAEEDGYDVIQAMIGDIWYHVTSGHAVNCAAALLQGLTGLKIDINHFDPVTESTPLFLGCFSPKFVKLFMRYGATTDVICQGRLPFKQLLVGLSEEVENQDHFSSKPSIYMKIVFMCTHNFHRMELESLRLLFDNTQGVEKVIYHCVKDMEVTQIAALLFVAREELMSPSFFKGLCDCTLNGSMSLRQLVLSEIASLTASQITLVSTSEEMDELKNKLEIMMSMLHVIEVFERFGDKIELYSQNVNKLGKEETASQVAYFLISAGFAEYKDFKLTYLFSLPSYWSEFHEDFLELLESKLGGENEGRLLWSGATKIYEPLSDAMWMAQLSDQQRLSLTSEAVPVLNNEDDARGSLPIIQSLEKLRHHPFLNDWTPKQSIFKLVCILCLPQLKEYLTIISSFASKIEEIEAIGCHLAWLGKLIELASLLMVDATTSPRSNYICSNAIHQYIMSDIRTIFDAEVKVIGRNDSHKVIEKCKAVKEMRLSALLLLEVFEKAGVSINQYLQSETYNDGTKSNLQIARDILSLLEKAGFALKPEDTDLNDIDCFSTTLDTIDCTSFSNILDPVVSGKLSTSLVKDGSLPKASQPHVFSVIEHVFGMRGGHQNTPLVRGLATRSRPFHTMVHKNSELCSSRVFTPNASRKKKGLFLSIGVAITNVIKRV
ncbi:hypothetical protein GQ457_14G020510 [Hibiscus cannabinus]